MAYWQFDLTFTNLGALPAGSSGVLVNTLSSTGSDALHFGILSGPGDLTIGASTAAPGGSALGPFPAFELSASDQVWFTVMLADGSNTMTNLHSIGPYTVGDVGTEVPAP